MSLARAGRAGLIGKGRDGMEWRIGTGQARSEEVCLLKDWLGMEWAG